jgi:hypothetical protein
MRIVAGKDRSGDFRLPKPLSISFPRELTPQPVVGAVRR